MISPGDILHDLHRQARIDKVFYNLNKHLDELEVLIKKSKLEAEVAKEILEGMKGTPNGK